MKTYLGAQRLVWLEVTDISPAGVIILKPTKDKNIGALYMNEDELERIREDG